MSSKMRSYARRVNFVHPGEDGYHLPLWDALIVRAAQPAGCSTLYSEDLQNGQVIDGLRIVNPFKKAASR